jgi:hypothetical protein
MTSHQQRALERALVDAFMKSMRQAMENVVVAFRHELADILSSLDDGALPRTRKGTLGQPKSCSVCRLKGTRNDAALPASHTQEDHRRWKADWPASAGRRRSNEDAA